MICYQNFAKILFASSDKLFHKTLFKKKFFIKIQLNRYWRAQSEQQKHENKVRDMFKISDENARARSINEPKAPLFPPILSHPHELNTLKTVRKEFYKCELLGDVLDTTEKMVLSEKRVLFMSVFLSIYTPPSNSPLQPVPWSFSVGKEYEVVSRCCCSIMSCTLVL